MSVAFTNIKQIREEFIKDGWNEDISFEELTLEEAKIKGYIFAVDGIKKERKYFKMNVTGNIFDDKGKVVLYNVKTR